MERREQVLRLQAELEAKKSELAQLQRRVHKAEVCRRSQQSGTNACGVHSQHLSQEKDEKSISPSVTSSHVASQVLVRSQTDPHSPIWISGEHYPAQYLIRQTRSMSKIQQKKPNTISLQIKPPSFILPEKEFDLPNDTFLNLKLLKLKQGNSHTYPSDFECHLVKDSGTPLELKCIQIIPCLTGKVGHSDGKLVVRSGGTCVISFDGDISVYQWMTGECWTHSLKQAITSLELICMRGGVFVFGIAHSGCLAVLTLTGNDWERYSLPTDHLAWPTDYHCQHMCMSELGDGSVLVVASCSDIVGAWCLDSHNHWSVAIIGSYTVSSLCSLTLAQDVLLAATSQHQLVVHSLSSTCPRCVFLSCCPGLSTSYSTNVLPRLLAAKNVNDVLVIVLTYKGTSRACVSGDVAGWIIAIKNGDNVPYLLHTFRIPIHLLCRRGLFDLHAKTHAVNGWDLVAVSHDLHQLYVWKGPQEYPGTTLSVRATQGTASVSGVDWDPTSESCLLLDKLTQLHCFQNSDIQ